MLNQNFYLLLTLLFAVSDLLLFSKYLKLKKGRRDYEVEALKRSQRIIDKAITRASEIVSRSQGLEDEVRQKIAQSSSDLSDQQRDVYAKIIDQIKTELTQVVQDASNDIKRDAQEEVSAFANSMREETISTEQDVKAKISNEYVKLEADLAEYRRQRMLEAQREIEELVNKVSVKVLGKSLSSEDEKALIVRTLEEAKKNNVF